MDIKLLFDETIPEPKRWEPLSDKQAMRLAMQEAFKGAGKVSPNPLVGCVILDANNRFLSKGYHTQVGSAHAEAEALSCLSETELKGAKVYVTLEPCAHQGRTPSCAKSLAKLNISKVVYGLQDPNPLVAGQGIQILKDAGIEVVSFLDLIADNKALWQSRLDAVCEHFLWNFHEKKVFVSLKVASSLDGQLALKSGESRWITGEKSRAYAHYLRAFHGAVAVGKNTILRDDPVLNVRSSGLAGQAVKIVVFDHQGELLGQDLKVFASHAPENLIWVISDKTTKRDPRVGHYILAPNKEQNVRIAVDELYKLGVRALMVEGGAELISSFMREKLAQRIYLFQAPIILGAQYGRSWSQSLEVLKISEGLVLNNIKWQRFGVDILLSAKFN